MILSKFLIGIALIIASIVAPIVCIIKTPNNLRGFYGAMFWSIALIGIIGGISLTITAFA